MIHIENLNFCVLFARMGKARPNNKWNIDLITEPVEWVFLDLICSESSLLFYSANAVFIVALFCAVIIFFFFWWLVVWRAETKKEKPSLHLFP